MVLKEVLVPALICLCLSIGIVADSLSRVKRAPTELHREDKEIIKPQPPNDAGYAKIDDRPIDAKPKGPVKIAETDECREDVQRLCADKAKANNFLVLDCLQDSITATESLTEKCNHYLWNYKKKLSHDIRLDRALDEACSPDLEKIPECKKLQKGEGKIIPCLIDHYEEVKHQPCNSFLNKMASIIFSDYHFMEFFIANCSKDIEKLQCGRLENVDIESTSGHLQGKTITCLNAHRKNVTKQCKKALLRVAELQSDDYHLDRPLYYACKGDRENLCHDVVSGEGAVFKCLYKHIGDPELTPDCKDKLEARQALIAEDIKADKSFYRACSHDIQENKCFRGKGEEIDESLGRSSVLLCLEKAQSEGKQKVTAECIQAMFELRSELMQDYKISPELVSSCETEIAKYCNGLEVGGSTINCLMKLAATKNNQDNNYISSACTAQLSELLSVVNPGGTVALIAPLQQACADVVTKACHDHQAGHGDVITCLLENIDHEDMTDECEEQLLIIQYFAVRDFRLDAHLYKQCQKDAVEICHTNAFSDTNTMEPEMGPLIFSLPAPSKCLPQILMTLSFRRVCS
ncbi:glycogenin glucosyltransferase glg1 [Bulinus truncatus]|nr:glycogenin glucosyltransferase glg1 [Bulinus truncatus]